MRQRIVVRAAAVVACCALVACGLTPPVDEHPGDPAYAPLQPSSPRPDFAAEGGIKYAGFGSSLYSDRRAMLVGDIITVTLVESTAATKDAKTDIKKDATLDMGNSTAFGKAVELGSYTTAASAAQNRQFEGDAQSSQSNSLDGNITVSVTEIMPNGLLRVRGEKWLQLNRGKEYIRLTGLLRAEDVGSDNTVLSTRLADARINYSGTGEFAQSNNMGWLHKILNSGWWPL